MPRLRRIGIFGGSFDPVHVGHLIMAAELRTKLRMDKVLFEPVPISPFVDKAMKEPPRAKLRDRIRMLELALAYDPTFDIDLTDANRPGTDDEGKKRWWTSELLQILTKNLAPATLIFLIGADHLRDFLGWHEPATIVRLVELGVASRPGVAYDLDSVFADPVFAEVPEVRYRVHEVPIPQIEVSSTVIRRRVAAREPITYHVPLEVERYIAYRKLYRV